MPVSVDRQGFTYETLLQYQRAHLKQWLPRVKPSLFEEVHEYVIECNHQADTSDAKHQVYRGQDLVEILFTWPNLGPCYQPRVKEGEEFV